VAAETVEEHRMHAEYYEFPQETADLIRETKKRGGRVIAVGTTACRTLETVGSRALEQALALAGTTRQEVQSLTGHGAEWTDHLQADAGWTDIFIFPGYTFKVIDGLVTNFHLPKSSLIMLVSALAGRENVMDAYAEAVKERYRFFSFGDAMLIV
jgi:S-adenosylmethionine:tRNA ribosyltransferase-isomerase